MFNNVAAKAFYEFDNSFLGYIFVIFSLIRLQLFVNLGNLVVEL